MGSTLPTFVPLIPTLTMSLSRLSLYPLITMTLTNPSLVHGRSGSNMLVDSAGLVRQPVTPSPHSCLVKAVLITTLGIYLGASISQKMAAFLEENELFVPQDDDDEEE